MTFEKAIELAHHDRDGFPLNRLVSPPPTVSEAIEILKDSLRRRGHTWLTGEAAVQVLNANKNQRT